MLDIKIISKNFIESQVSEQLSFRFFNACKIIIIDNCEELSESGPLYTFFTTLIYETFKKIKFIFIFKGNNFSIKEGLFNISKYMLDTYQVPIISQSIAIEKFPFLSDLVDSRKLTIELGDILNAPIDPYIENPFYLNLLVMYYYKYQSLGVNFSSTDNFIQNIMQDLLSSKQISIARRLVLLSSQNKNTSEFPEDSDLQYLITRGIIVKQQESFAFSHMLYEEWAIRLVLDMRLTTMIESNDDTIHIYREILRILPRHKKQCYAYLSNNRELQVYYRSINSNSEITNSALYFLKFEFDNKASQEFMQHKQLMELLVDIVPDELLLFQKKISNSHVVSRLFEVDDFRIIFIKVFTRSFCLSENMIISGNLFFNILSILGSKNLLVSPYGKTCDENYYMEHFFVNALSISWSMGMMSFSAKLHFLKHHFTQPDVYSSYFYYIYDGLLKAADPHTSGEASYPHHSAYFRNENGTDPDGYTSYQGKFFPFNKGDIEEEIAYHSAAMRILVNYCNSCNENKSEVISEILKVIKHNIGGVIYNMATELVYILDVAVVVFSEIILNDALYDTLNVFLSSREEELITFFSKSEINVVTSATFTPDECRTISFLQLERIKDILEYRKNHKYVTYELRSIKFLLTKNDIPLERVEFMPQSTLNKSPSLFSQSKTTVSSQLTRIDASNK